MRGEVKEVWNFLTMTLISLLADDRYKKHYNYDIQGGFLIRKAL